jgi:hypothetical protein
MNVMPVRLPLAGRCWRQAGRDRTPPVKTIDIEVAFLPPVLVPFVMITSGLRPTIGGQCRQPIAAALGPAVFDRHVLSFDIAGIAQSLVERPRTVQTGRATTRG